MKNFASAINSAGLKKRCSPRREAGLGLGSAKNEGGSRAPNDVVPTLGQSLAYSPSQAAHVAGISRATLYRHVQSGALQTRKCGARTLILAEELVAFLRALPTAIAGKDSAR